MSKFWSEMAKRTKPYIPGEQINKENIVKLNTNENPYPPSPKVLAAINNQVGEKLRLYPSPTMDDLRTTIGDYYELKKEQVFIGNGSDEVLAFSFMAFFDPDKTILFPEVSYSFYPVYASLFNIPYEKLPLESDFTIDARKYFNSPGGVIFPNPNAPTSRYLAIETVEKIVQQNPNQVVIIDEAYVDFAPASAATLVKSYPNLLVIQTMSKSRSLAGLRIGFALGDARLIEALIRMKDSFNSYPVDRLAMAGAMAAIQDVAYFKSTTEKIVQTRKWVEEELEELGFYVHPSEANFVFITHPAYEAKKLYEQLRDRDILVRYFGKPPIEDYLRVSIGTDDEMRSFLNVLQTILD